MMKRVLGIDPGTNFLGYGIIERTEQNKFEVVISGILELKKIGDSYKKLTYIFERIDTIISEYSPKVLSVESPFYGKNAQSMLKLGRVQGVAIAAAIKHGLQIYEYAPRKIKLSITGNGNASKEQVAAMVVQMLKMSKNYSVFDETDALAAALCHLLQKNIGIYKKQYTNWQDFIQKNKDRLL